MKQKFWVFISGMDGCNSKLLCNSNILVYCHVHVESVYLSFCHNVCSKHANENKCWN